MNDFTDEEFIGALIASNLILQSNSFRKSCDILESNSDFKKELLHEKEHEILHVLFVNLMFAIELAYKALIYLENKTPNKTHKIKLLKEQLSVPVQNIIREKCLSKDIDKFDFKVIAGLTDEYTIQRYNEGCLVLNNHLGLKKFHDSQMETIDTLKSKNKAFQYVINNESF